ncbi:MAG: hypothetical protein ACFE9T_13935 [Promethearchaeota archaeon]
MFNLEEFENGNLIFIVDKLNKYLEKNKLTKISKLLEELEELLDKQENFAVPITYILSILAESNFELISESLIQRIVKYLHSDNSNLKINSITIIGFAIMSKMRYYKEYSLEFIQFLIDKSEDIRNNVHYFLSELASKNPEIITSNRDLLIESLLIENRKENIISLLNYLTYYDDLNFDQLYKLRNALKTLIKSDFHEKTTEISVVLLKIIKKYFPYLKDFDLQNQKPNQLEILLDNQFLMNKVNFTEVSKYLKVDLKEYLNTLRKSPFKNEKVYFYVKIKDDIINIYEFEKAKLINFFNEDKIINHEKIINTFSQIIENNLELKSIIKTLLNLRIINGYYSNLGNFYPNNYLKYQLLNNFQVKGMVNLKNYNFLPSDFIQDLIQDIENSTKQKILLSKDKNAYYSLKKIQEQINSEAAKNNVIDLLPFRERLLDKDFITLIKNLPKEFLSTYHKGTQWITNIGLLKIKKEIENSKLIGYFEIDEKSEKLEIRKTLLMDVLEHDVDLRSGIWDNEKNKFYYSKYLKERIDEINLLSNEEGKKEQIKGLANELNIEINHILTKIDENLRLIGEEIKQQDQIKITEYIEKTGMDNNKFFDFLNDLGLNYLKKGDIVIFSPVKIEEAKNNIKFTLIDKSKSVDYISLGTFDITSNLIEELIKDLLSDAKLKGIFYDNGNEILFYTERGIRNLMLHNSFLFSFHDLFYGKELSEEEIKFLREIFEDLVKRQKLKGHFDENLLTFSSDEVLFANDYNSNLYEFFKMVDSYNQRFELEFLKIKKILCQQDKTIYPKEIKIVEEAIDRINEKYVFWRDGLETFIKRVNIKLLRDQGFSVKKYKNLSNEIKEKREIKSFEEDVEVYEYMKFFYNWIKLFNNLEIKYPNIIFYQKRFINNPEDKESKKKYNELLENLNLM